ncbi:parasite-infected erythrocyte surface protein [Plasmodium chabaudi adami]|uniref:Parasite-infected erythrocyte surface protein n=1 Tax=Plasmodium chabaudi adami TaxID=5826 RepID=A0A1C6XCQ6_PLACE|nr:parasite-infected erythrocyte surface protein [Plasmodium chabaudi adami]
MKVIIWLLPLLILSIVIKCDNKIKDNIFQNLRKKTKFLVINEPIVDLDFSENLFHSLLFDLEVYNNNIYALDENLLNLQNLNHSSIFKLLTNTYEQVSKENEKNDEQNKIKYIIIASSHTRVHPINLEYLLLKFDKYIYNGNIYQNGDIDIKGILNEYNNEIKESLEKKKKFKNISNIIDEKYKDDIVSALLNKDIGSSDKFIKRVDNSNDSNSNYNNQYKGMFVGYGFNDDEPSILHNLNENKNFLFPSMNSGIILDIILLKNIYENYINIQKQNEKIIHKDYIYEISKFIYGNIHVELVHFENTCLDAKQNVYLTNKENTEFDVYKYYITKNLFEDYGSLSIKEIEEKNYENIVMSYFQLAYPITTCATYSGRSQNETFIGFDKFNMISIENDEKLKYYIKETEEISFNDIEEYKRKFNDINKRYDEILDNGENNLTHKDIVLGIKSSINTEDRISYIKKTFDNKKNNKHIFSNFKITPVLKNQKETSIINTELLKGGFDSEDIDIQIFYMSDKESKLFNTVKYDIDGVSKNSSCEKMKQTIFHFYEEYVENDKNKNNNKNMKKQKYLFIGNDDTYVNIKNLVDVMNVSSNKCVHIKKHMYDKYLKSFRFLKKNEPKFFKNFNEKAPLFYQYLKQNLIDTIRNLKKYNYIPKYCKDNNNGIGSTPKSDVPILLGKRQSYNTFYNDNESYDYLASEAGILINDSFAKKIYFCKNCVCPNNEQSDGMMLGEWANKLNLLTINFEGFFQSHPANYNKKYLNTLVPITYNNLNFNKTVDEIKKTYFQHLVNYNKDEIDEKTDSYVDYLDQNFKNTFDNIFHYFFYLKRYYNSSNDEQNNDISKINKKIYAKMEYNGSYKKLFNLSHFFKEEIENMIQFKHNKKNGTRKGKVNYANNYVIENSDIKTNDNYENEELEQDDYNDDSEEDDEDDLFSEDDFDYDEFIKDIENSKRLYKEQAQQFEKKENTPNTSSTNKHDTPKSDDTPNEDHNTEL